MCLKWIGRWIMGERRKQKKLEKEGKTSAWRGQYTGSDTQILPAEMERKDGSRVLALVVERGKEEARKEGPDTNHSSGEP